MNILICGTHLPQKKSVTKVVDVLAAKGKRACVECVRYIGKLSEISTHKNALKKKITPTTTCNSVLSTNLGIASSEYRRTSSHICLQALFECPAQSTQQVCVRRNGPLPIVC